MITIGQALEQNRVVMAVPGRADSPFSAGCNQLIRSGARLVATVDDVVDELDDLASGAGRAGAAGRASAAMPPLAAGGARKGADDAAKSGAPLSSLPPDERKVYEAIGAGPAQIDALIRATGLPAGRIGAVVTCLQIKRLAKMLPGGMVARAK